MTSADAYLERVARGMTGLDRRLREDVLKELRAHLADAVAADGEAAIASMDPPEAVAARYRDLYGYGATFRAIFVLAAALVAAFTLPIFVSSFGVLGALVVADVFLLVLAAYLILVGVRAGPQTGALAGIAAFVVRLAVVLAYEPAAIHVIPDASGWVTFLVVSAALIAIGFLPGPVKERLKPRDVSL